MHALGFQPIYYSFILPGQFTLWLIKIFPGIARNKNQDYNKSEYSLIFLQEVNHGNT